MEPLWYVKNKLIVQEQKDGKLLPRSHMIIKKGDFVNVAVAMQIDVKPPLAHPRIRVNLVMKEIVLLESKSLVSRLSRKLA